VLPWLLNPEGVDADDVFMRVALLEAQRAYAEGEVPVGAIVVHHGRILARGRNAVEREQDATLHAEMQVIREASRHLGRRLEGCTLYVTLEPCPMCAGAIVWARIPRVVFAAADPRAGACGTLYNIVQDERLNHRCQLRGGVRAEEAAELLRRFFRQLREEERGVDPGNTGK
jgi:tRNA(adenine34) deaminase